MRYLVTWQEVVEYLESYGLTCMLKEGYRPDTGMTITDRKGWDKIVPNITYSGEYYVAEVADCDDYSQKASADSGFYYRRKALQCWGDTPDGYHAFCLCLIADADHHIIGHVLFEPNAGFKCAGKTFLPLENGYLPQSWK